MSKIRCITPEDLTGHNYERATLPMGLRFHDTNPKKRGDRGLTVRVCLGTVVFAKDDPKGDVVVAANTQLQDPGVYIVGRKGGMELVLDTASVYLVTRMAYIGVYTLRVEIGKALWDITTYYYADNRRDDMDQYVSIETAFDHDDRYWQAVTMGGVVIPQRMDVKRIEHESDAIDIDLEKLPLLDGRKLVEHLCIFDNIPEAEPEEDDHPPTGIIDPTTGRPFA